MSPRFVHPRSENRPKMQCPFVLYAHFRENQGADASAREALRRKPRWEDRPRRPRPERRFRECTKLAHIAFSSGFQNADGDEATRLELAEHVERTERAAGCGSRDSGRRYGSSITVAVLTGASGDSVSALQTSTTGAGSSPASTASMRAFHSSGRSGTSQRPPSSSMKSP